MSDVGGRLQRWFSELRRRKVCRVAGVGFPLACALAWAFDAAPLLIATHRSFPLTPLVYWLIALHSLILILGGHYTYARVPLGFWIQDWFDFARNHYDRIGHLLQGFGPAIILRELLLRTSPLMPGRWLFTLVLFGILGVSATYEFIEWGAAQFLFERLHDGQLAVVDPSIAYKVAPRA